MGFDKALIEIDGERLAVRIARLAQAVAEPVLELGPGHTGLVTVSETEPGGGPLLALADGVDALRRAGFDGPALVLSTDLVLIDAPTLAGLARAHPGRSVVPLLDGVPQPLCARWSAPALDSVAALVRAGERSLRPLLTGPDVMLSSAFAPDRLADADTPEDLDLLGIDWARP